MLHGRHLHLECSTTQNWNCDTFLNPCSILGIPNEDNLIIKYSNISTIKKKKFKWVLYENKLRLKRLK